MFSPYINKEFHEAFRLQISLIATIRKIHSYYVTTVIIMKKCISAHKPDLLMPGCGLPTISSKILPAYRPSISKNIRTYTNCMNTNCTYSYYSISFSYWWKLHEIFNEKLHKWCS